MWSIDYRNTPQHPSSNPLPSPLPIIHSFGYMDYFPAWTFYWHVHDEDTECVLVVNGAGHLHIGEHIVPIHAGCICIVPRMMMHYYSSTDDDPMEYYVIEVDTVEREVPITKWLLAPHARVFRAEQYAGHFQFILDAISNQVAKKHHIAGEDLQTAVYTLLSWLQNRSLKIKEENYTEENFELHDVLLHIAGHFPEPITLEELCEIHGTSPASLNRSFNRFCGMSPVNYLIYFRIVQSLRLLQYTNLPIAEISYLVGYQNQTHFSRLFDRHIGKTPAAFRGDLRKKLHAFLDAQNDAEIYLPTPLRSKKLPLPGAEFRLH